MCEQSMYEHVCSSNISKKKVRINFTLQLNTKEAKIWKMQNSEKNQKMKEKKFIRNGINL